MKYLIPFLISCLLLLIGCDNTATDPGATSGKQGTTKKQNAKIQSTNVAKYSAISKDGKFKRGEFDKTHLTQVTYFKENGQTDKKYWYSKDRKIVSQMKVTRGWKGLDSMAVIKNEKMAVKRRLVYKLNEIGNKVATVYYDPKYKLIKTYSFGYNDNQNLIQESERDAAGNILMTTTYVYDQNGEQIGMKTIKGKETVISEEKYEITKHDNKGNWIQKHVYTKGEVSHIINRQLGYY